MKADKKLNNIMDKFPEKIAAIASDSFPCLVKADTVITVEYDFIEVIDTLPLFTNTTDTIIKVEIKNRTIKIPSKTIYITNYVIDSAKIVSLENKLRLCSTKVVEPKKKESKILEILGILFALLGVLFYFVGKKK